MSGLFNVTVETPDVKSSTELLAASLNKAVVGLYIALGLGLAVWLYVELGK
jgi:hypothetical protein